MDTEYTTFTDDVENQAPPSYTVRVGDLGKVDLCAEDQRLTVAPEGNQSDDELSDDGLSSVDETFDVLSITSSIDDRLTWRGRMQEVLHSSYFHFFIIILVVLDVLFVLFELLLDLGAFNNVRCFGLNLREQQEFCHFDINSRNFCAPHARLILKGIAIYPKSESESGEEVERELCECGFRNGREVCVRESESEGVNPAIILHAFSLLILTIFLIEILCKIIAFRLKYFTHKFEVLDGAVVVISWILDVASIVEEEAFEAAQLLIVLRLWRILRVINGSILSSKAQSDAQLSKAKVEAKRTIHALHKAQDKLVTVEKENEEMKKRMESSDVPEHQPFKQKDN